MNRLKFDREVARLDEQRPTLEARGVFVLSSTSFPWVELLVVPCHPLQIPVASSQSGSIVLPQITVTMSDIPNLSARAFKARFDLTDYDLRAPSLEFRDPWNNSDLQYPTMFRALEYEETRKAYEVLIAEHPTTHKPFLCLRGIREYHEHPQHSGDDWLLYRGKMSLFSIVMSMWRVTVDLVHPSLNIQPNRIHVQWTAEEKL